VLNVRRRVCGCSPGTPARAQSARTSRCTARASIGRAAAGAEQRARLDPANRQPLVDGDDGLGGQHLRPRVAALPRDPQDLGALLLPDVGDLQADGLGAAQPGEQWALRCAMKRCRA
jgi:hypothetical protein